MINLEWYRIFWHTAKTGNLTKAAHELFITQPSVSYAIKQMEEAVGLKLFHRLAKGVELTAEGRALLSYVEQSLALLDAGERQMDALKRLAGGELRIGASESIVKHWLLPWLEAYRNRFPAVRIQLSHGKTPDLVKRLKDGRTDCIFVPGPTNEEQLEAGPITTMQDCFVVGETYLDMAKRPLTAAEIAAAPLLLLSPGSSARRHAEMWFAGQGVSVRPDIELGSVDLLVDFASKGFGAAYVPRTFAADAIDKGKLHELQTVVPVPARTIELVVRRGFPLPLPAARFVEMTKG